MGFQPSAGHQDELATLEEPQNLSQLRDYVIRFRPPKVQVVVKFATGLMSKSPVNVWFEYPPQSDDGGEVINHVVTVVAFAGKDYSLRYTEDLDPGLERAKRQGDKMVEDFDRFQAMWDQLDLKEREEGIQDAFQANCSSAVSVTHSGLNLAFDLGILSLEEFRSFSEQLGGTYSSLFVFVDDMNHLRHITYYDSEETFHREVTCFEHDSYYDYEGMPDYLRDYDDKQRDLAAETMVSFWRDVWKRRSHWVETRRQGLGPLIRRLETLLSDSSSGNKKKLASPHSRCLAELKKVVQHHKVLMYSLPLHAIKFFLTHYAYTDFKKRCRGVTVKASSDDSLVRLSVSGLTVFNTNTYFDCKSDVDFFSSSLWNPWVGPEPSEVLISHNKKLLRNQHVTVGGHKLTLSKFCRERGYLLARTIGRKWRDFGVFLLDTFGFDVHGLAVPPSASFLAFQCVWTRFAETAGIMCQGPERCKPSHEDLLRECSRGGFMFSAETAISQGDRLSTTHTARSISEWDLVSAYGYAASKCLVPSGFCTGFGNVSEIPGAEDAREGGAGQRRLLSTTTTSALTRLDTRARHKSFEYQAVYRIINDLGPSVVRRAYHNYSPLGVFTLGKYNLDLAIVTHKGQLMLFNADGRFAHSCDTCPLPPVEKRKFVGRQTHEQLRAKSNQRDAAIREWARAFSTQSLAAGGPADAVTYQVVHDCHTQGFTPGNLKATFSSTPALLELVKGYRITDRLANHLTLDLFRKLVEYEGSDDQDNQPARDDSFTYIVKADVSVLPPTEWICSSSSNDNEEQQEESGSVGDYDTTTTTEVTLWVLWSSTRRSNGSLNPPPMSKRLRTPPRTTTTRATVAGKVSEPDGTLTPSKPWLGAEESY